jgi:hypothetical protein
MMMLLAKDQLLGLSLSSCNTYLLSISHLFFLPARMASLAMVMRAPLVKGLPWKTFTRQELKVSMGSLLVYLEFLMVCIISLERTFCSCLVFLKNRTSLRMLFSV